MGTSRQQKAASRRAIVDTAARLFRERGIDGVSVAEIMDGAGLTHGGFPRHFANKQELVGEALAAALTAQGGEAGLAAFADAYLRPEHRDNPGAGCVYAALGPEASRGSAETRHLLTQTMERQIALFAQTTPGETEQQRRNAAIGGWSTMIGAMILARLSDSNDLSQEILSAARSYLDVETTPSVKN